MRVLIISTSERSGGAAVAASRLTEALNRHGVQATMLVRDKETDNPSVVTAGRRLLMLRHFLWERLCLFFHLRFSRRHLFHIDMANAGADITRLKVFKEADIIHLHWINQGMLSLKGIRKIILSGKPVVWTLHDIWPATAICHLTLGCEHFTDHCHHCPYLSGRSHHDLSYRVWQQKAAMLTDARVAIVGCSEWLAGEARRSALLKSQPITAIPNPIDTHVFSPRDKSEARRRLNLPADKRIILFVAQRIGNAYKGINYLSEALSHLCSDHSDIADQLSLVLLGSATPSSLPVDDGGSSRLERRSMGYISDPSVLADVYSAADVFVLPSLSENLPNTIMEAMACGTPCIGFRVGGIPEMIDHKQDGYVADYCDAVDLARGLYWLLYEADRTQLSAAAVMKVVRCYSQAAVAAQYGALYKSLVRRTS